MLNYTKGEWKAKPKKGVILGEDTSKFVVGTDSIWVALTTNGEDAYLISAAPNMYKALKAIIDEARGTDRFSDDNITDAIIAISKANGGK